MYRNFQILFAIILIITTSCSTSKSQTVEITGNQFPYPDKMITLDENLKIAYVDKGKGDQTLLFIHGLGSYAAAWKKNIEVLRDNYRCIAMDLPGYGQSQHGDYPYNIDWYAAKMDELILKLGLKNVTVVGHSMGGQIAMKMALKHKNNFNNLVLISPAGFEKFNTEERAFFEKNVTSEAVKNTSHQRTNFNFSINFVKFPEDAKFMVQDRIALESKPHFDNYCQMIPKCVMAMLDQPVWQDLSLIDKSTLIFFGEKEALIPNKFLHPTMKVDEVANFGHAHIKNSKLVMVPECGHFAQWEGAEIVNNEIIKFLNK